MEPRIHAGARSSSVALLTVFASLACAVGRADVQAAATAPSYPLRPIRLIVPFAPGGGTDFLARLLGAKLQEAMGQTVVVDNRGGAGGVIGAEMAARSPADGYTLLLGSPGALTINPNMTKVPYDPLKDFTAVIQATISPFCVTAHPSLPVSSVKELVAYAKSRPGALNYGTSGAGASGHIEGELFKLLAGVDIVHIPFKGSGLASTALLAGEVQLVFENLPVALPIARAGKARILGVGSIERSQFAPEIPTFREGGVAGYEAITSFGIVAPAGTPPAVITRLNRELAGILGAQDNTALLNNRGMQVVGGPPEVYGKFLERELKATGEVIRKAGIRIE